MYGGGLLPFTFNQTAFKAFDHNMFIADASVNSVYIFLLITNLMHFFMYLVISSLYMFRASQCSSSGDGIVLIHHLV